MSSVLAQNETSLFGVFVGVAILSGCMLSYVSTTLLVIFLFFCAGACTMFELGHFSQIRIGSSDSIIVREQASILALLAGVASVVTYVLYRSSVPFMLAFWIFCMIFVFIYNDFVDRHNKEIATNKSQA
jgi:hypothetical protein